MQRFPREKIVYVEYYLVLVRGGWFFMPNCMQLLLCVEFILVSSFNKKLINNSPTS